MVGEKDMPSPTPTRSTTIAMMGLNSRERATGYAKPLAIGVTPCHPVNVRTQGRLLCSNKLSFRC